MIALVLLACALVIYTQFRHFVDGRLDSELRERSVAFVALARKEVHPVRIVELSGEEYTQVFDASGRLQASSRSLTGRAALTTSQLLQARAAPVTFTTSRIGPGGDGARVRAFAIDGRSVAFIAEPLTSRERELHRLATLLALVFPGALILASFAGYRVAGAALNPVERMRRRAESIGSEDAEERLPQPGTKDEIDRLAGTLNELLDRLHAAIAHERRVVGDASHELRTPISVLRMRLDVALRSGSRDGEELHEVLIETKADADRLTRLADDLLLLARADQGRLPMRTELVELDAQLSAAADRHRAAAAESERTIRVETDTASAPVIEADPDRLSQILDNLIANSLRYGSGEIHLTLRDAPPGRITLKVFDDGAGFPDGFAPTAFDRFSQADSSHGGSGSGLGLAIVAAITGAHGWTAEAHPGPGATVSITAPLA